ncbi:sister chromatid cohesion protein PDS5 homolog C-like isoform X2 [Cornus florida]|uniref:sister chromatid cohesion protein PDS5 homolog C-like isoform X2 n=1 Tax=Cornus florida TaxID=4283 RepID=UPI00289A1969|nr:sister chromatid cohesion protein PDS5 homolog C-like isoform X2 [Cornus florida]
MASVDKELEEQLLEAGNRLLQPPSSVDELLPLLDRVENFLSRVEQSPSKPMQAAISPSTKALVVDELLRHPDVDVKVAVASCISEITRITAPEAPYSDDQMKDVFHLIVSSFENLSDKSSRSYNKRTLILETVAKVRSCVVMLDLECEGLIVEMFQHFLKAISDDHPENVFSSMETIMTLVLEESEDISLELLTPILASVKKDNEEVLPIARKLGEKVLKNCGAKLKTCLTQAVGSSGLSLDDYSDVLVSIYEGTTDGVEHNDDNALVEQSAVEGKLAQASSEKAAQADESELATASSDEAAQVSKERVTELVSPEEISPPMDKSSKSAMINGVAETGNESTPVDPECVNKPVDDHNANQSVNTSEMSEDGPDDLDADRLVKSETKPEQTLRKRGRKPSSLITSTEPSVRGDIEKETERLPDRRKSRKEVHSSAAEDPSAEAVLTSENGKGSCIQVSSPQASESKAVTVASASPNGSLPEESRPKKSGRPKKKENMIQEASPSADVSKKASEETPASEQQKRAGKRIPAGITNEVKTPASEDKSKNEIGTKSDSEAKPLKQSGKKTDASNNLEDGKRRGRTKGPMKKDKTKSSAMDVDKEVVSPSKSNTKLAKDDGHIEEIPKTNSKRKRTPGKVTASDSVELGENLVGSKVKVWWPDDDMFYDGVIDSFDSVKKKHKVLYIDGDEEILNLKEERWELVDGNSHSVSDGEQATEHASPDTSSDMQKKKKAKTSSGPSTKQGKMGVSPKGSGGASSSKLKVVSTKSGDKSKNDSKVSGKLKVNTPKSGAKSEDDTSGKSKDRSQRSGKSIDNAPKLAGKTKDDGATPKTSTKSKQGTPKTANKGTSKTASKDMPKVNTEDAPKSASKARTPRSGRKSSVSGAGKVKSNLSKERGAKDLKEKSPDLAKSPEAMKGELPDTPKARESEAKSGKKRRRGAKS